MLLPFSLSFGFNCFGIFPSISFIFSALLYMHQYVHHSSLPVLPFRVFSQCWFITLCTSAWCDFNANREQNLNGSYFLQKTKRMLDGCREWSTSDFHSFDIPNGEANHLSGCQPLSVCGWMSALLRRQQLQITVNHRTNSVPNFSETHLQVQIFLYIYTHTPTITQILFPAWISSW